MRIPEYPWLMYAGIRVPNESDVWINTIGALGRGRAGTGEVRTIVAPDNAYDVLDLSTLKIPEGYEIDGASAAEAFGEIKEGSDTWLGVNGEAHSGEICAASLEAENLCGDPVEYQARRIRLRKVAPKTRKVLVVEYFDPTPALDRWARLTCPLESENSSEVRIRAEERPI